jgi:hypothetical protein
MPEISRFFGIIIRMFVEAGGQHHIPHFHAYYQDQVGIYDIGKIEPFGWLPSAASGATRVRLGRASSRRVVVELADVATGSSTYYDWTIEVTDLLMAHEIYRVFSFEKIAPFTLRIQFDDGTSQTIDFRPVLKGELYGPLQDSTLFDRVRIDPEVHTLVWPNGADFDPAILRNWPESGSALTALADQWADEKHLTGSVT